MTIFTVRLAGVKVSTVLNGILNVVRLRTPRQILHPIIHEISIQMPNEWQTFGVGNESCGNYSVGKNGDGLRGCVRWVKAHKRLSFSDRWLQYATFNSA